MRALPSGPGAVLLEVDDPGEVTSLFALLTKLRDERRLVARDIVPGARTVLVDGTPSPKAVVELLRDWVPSRSATTGDQEVVLDVRYDGADLADVANRTGLSVAEVVETHSGAAYTVSFCGFVPGFAYLTGLPRSLQLPRREVPRTRVPAGSVAVAAEWAGVYPREGPGGWLLLGTTDARLWDPERPEPALLRPGTRVRFQPVPA